MGSVLGSNRSARAERRRRRGEGCTGKGSQTSDEGSFLDWDGPVVCATHLPSAAPPDPSRCAMNYAASRYGSRSVSRRTSSRTSVQMGSLTL